MEDQVAAHSPSCVAYRPTPHVPVLTTDSKKQKPKPFTARDLEDAGIEGVSPDGLKRAWKATFGREIEDVAEVRDLLGVNGGLAGKGTVNLSTGYGRIEASYFGPGVQVAQTFRAGGVVKTDALFIADHLQNSGLGSRILSTQIEQYRRLGVKTVNLEATEVGRYLWPKLGFEGDEKQLASYNAGFKRYMEARGLPTPKPLGSLQAIANATHNGEKVGKAFLLSADAPNKEYLSASVESIAKARGHAAPGEKRPAPVGTQKKPKERPAQHRGGRPGEPRGATQKRTRLAKPMPQPLQFEGEARDRVTRTHDRVEREIRALLEGKNFESIDAERTKELLTSLRAKLDGFLDEDQEADAAKVLLERVTDWNRGQFVRAVGIDVPEVSSAIGKRWVKETVSELWDITTSARTRVESLVLRASERGLRASAFEAELGRVLGLSKKDARKKAIGQVIRLHGRLTEHRQQKAGIKKYMWHAVGGKRGDGHTRRWHCDLHGTTHRWDSPPIGGGGGPHDRGTPGSADRCRCQAIAVIEF